jgi:hypothetical protein
MLRYLVFADIHHRFGQVEKLLRQLAGLYDRAVFLGDYFDSFPDTEEQAEATARWLAMSVQRPGRIHLLGNHDLPYIFPCQANRDHYCPGWTEAKHRRIRPYFDGLPCERIFKLAHAADAWLFSHAGLSYHKESFPASLQYGDLSAAGLAQAVNAHVPDLLAGKAPEWITRPGRRLIPTQGPGGILWAHWTDMVPIPGVLQCVGHTPRLGLRVKQQDGGMALCLDTSPASVLLMTETGDCSRGDYAVYPIQALLDSPQEAGLEVRLAFASLTLVPVIPS